MSSHLIPTVTESPIIGFKAGFCLAVMAGIGQMTARDFTDLGFDDGAIRATLKRLETRELILAEVAKSVEMVGDHQRVLRRTEYRVNPVHAQVGQAWLDFVHNVMSTVERSTGPRRGT